MKKLQVIFFLITSIIFNFNCISQTENNALFDSNILTPFDLRKEKTQGSSYINNNYLPAEISISKINYSIRYNAFLDEMETKTEGRIFLFPKNFNYTISFIGLNKKYQVFELNSKKQINKGFFVVLYKGNKISLLLKEKIKLTKEVIAKTSYEKSSPATLKRAKDVFFIGFEDHSSQKLPKKKKEFLKIFKQNKKQIEQFVKSSKLNIKNQDDLIKIFNYYDTLL